MTAAFDKLICALKNPDVWPDRPEHVKWRETHISWVILTRKSAWKIKKPVSFGFLDFSTLAQRKHFCEEELSSTGGRLLGFIGTLCRSAVSPPLRASTERESRSSSRSG